MNVVDNLIVGSGFAGFCIAYELKKINKDFLIITDQLKANMNTSALSYGHFRVSRDDLEKRFNIAESVKIGQDINLVESVYENSDLVYEFLNEMNLKYYNLAFGLKVKAKKRAGKVILNKLQGEIDNNILCSNELRSVNAYDTKGFIISLYDRTKDNYNNLRVNNLIFASGGICGKFEINNNWRYNNYNAFDILNNLQANVLEFGNIFYHPFSYNNGKNILTGEKVCRGSFINSKGDYIFNREIRKMLKENNYHEMFDELTSIINSNYSSGEDVFFLANSNSILIRPTAHYMPFGVKINSNCQVLNDENKVIDNLFAIGEICFDSKKNYGRLPGFSLTSIVVRANIIANYLNNKN